MSGRGSEDTVSSGSVDARNGRMDEWEEYE